MKKLLSLFLFAALSAFGQSSPRTFDTLQQMLNSNANDARTNCIVLGYWTSSDGGGGLFYFDRSNTAVTNAGLVFKSQFPTWTSVAGRYLRKVDGPLTPQMFGAVNGANATVAFQAALDAAESSASHAVAVEPGTYTITDTLTMGTRVSLEGFATEGGNTVSFPGTTLLIAHAGVGIQLDPAITIHGAGVWLRNLKIQRTVASTNPLVSFENNRGGGMDGCFIYTLGTGSGLQIGRWAFFNDIRNSKFAGGTTNNVCVDIYYPSTVNSFYNCQFYAYNGIGVRSEAQDQNFYGCDFEFCDIGFQATNSLFVYLGTTNTANASGTMFAGCHFEASVLGDFDVRGQSEIQLTLVAAAWASATNFIYTTGREIQNLSTLGQREYYDAGNAWNIAQLGQLKVGNSPFAGGGIIDLDFTQPATNAFFALNFFRNNTATGARYISVWSPTLSNWFSLDSSGGGRFFVGATTNAANTIRTGIGELYPSSPLTVRALSTNYYDGLSISGSDKVDSGAILYITKLPGTNTPASIQAIDSTFTAPLYLEPNSGNVGVGVPLTEVIVAPLTIRGVTNYAIHVQSVNYTNDSASLYIYKTEGTNTPAVIQSADKVYYTPLQLQPAGGTVVVGGSTPTVHLFNVGTNNGFQVNDPGVVTVQGNVGVTITNFIGAASGTNYYIEINGGVVTGFQHFP